MEETSANILNVIEILQEKFIILSGKQLLSNYITIRQTIIRARVWFFVVVLFFGNNLDSSLSSLLYYISVFNHSADKTITKSKEDREWCFQKTCIWGRQQPSIHLPVCGGG